MNATVGQAVGRIDGRLKVTGGARYTADVSLPGLVHAVLVDSPIARGRIRTLDTSAAERAPGVLAVITHLNAPPLFYPADAPRGGASTLRRVALRAFTGPEIHFAGQHVAVVVADTLERATYAAGLVSVACHEERPITVLTDHLEEAYRPERINGNRQTDTSTGDAEGGLDIAEAQVDATYVTPIEHHNPMELSACTAMWEGSGDARMLTVYDSTQGVYDLRTTLATTFGLPEARVRVVCEFLGGGFGGKLSARPHTVLAAIAADRVGRPVKLVVKREQMFTSIGYRPANVQRVRLGADRDGRLTGIIHDAVLGTATHEEWVEQSAALTRMLYACPNRRTTHRAVRLNLDTPTIMRAPGEAPGSFALESAVDELADKLGMDPIELRIRNYAETDPESGEPWSSNALMQCYRFGAERFGWSRRSARPRTNREGRTLVGFGVAAATRAVNLSPATVRVRLLSNGRAEIATAAHDIGTGTYTILAQIAGDILGLPPDRIAVALGDTLLPRSPTAGGSTTAPSVGSATHMAAQEAKRQLARLAAADRRSPLFGADANAVDLMDGRLAIPEAPRQAELIDDLLQRHGYGPNRPFEVEGRYAPPARGANFSSMYSFGAQFCEVRVDEDLGLVRVERMLGIFGVGRVLNAKTARSQLVGGMIGGIGMALLEGTWTDPRFGRFVNANMADYLVPVNADIRNVDAIWVDEADPHVNVIGAKGLGEIPIVGVAAAIANAVYNATGVRVRELPITSEKLLDQLRSQRSRRGSQQ
jgi:xanthine dehydrogenase YagR molybdenum-binding subunit